MDPDKNSSQLQTQQKRSVVLKTVAEIINLRSVTVSGTGKLDLLINIL